MWNLLSLSCFTCCCLIFAEGNSDCYPDLCANGGSCIRTGLEEAKYKCICQIGWQGELCQQKEGDPCSSNPCQNGGLCYNLYIQYLCICNIHWSGDNCQEPTKHPSMCGAWEFPCSNGGCTFARNRCDGRWDCKDGSDEESCVTIKPQPPCRPGMYFCHDNSCIPSFRHCDGFVDCVNETDEIDCPNYQAVTQPSVVTTSYKIHDTFTGIELAIITGFLLFTMCILLVLFAQKRGFRITRRQQASMLYRRRLREALDRLDVRACSHYPAEAPRVSNNQYNVGDQIIVSYNAAGDAIRFSENAWKHTFNGDPPPPYSDVIDINRETCPLTANGISSTEVQPPSYDDTVAVCNDRHHTTHHHVRHDRTNLHQYRIGDRRHGCNRDFETTI
ncbi:uncharacterized protein [Antedon mediterranea]|uniref:uncharacterized protein n=1 Tax=Antedon mediterranea TaxID=105859 RepID=UPI003AF47476